MSIYPDLSLPSLKIMSTIPLPTKKHPNEFSAVERVIKVGHGTEHSEEFVSSLIDWTVYCVAQDILNAYKRGENGVRLALVQFANSAGPNEQIADPARFYRDFFQSKILGSFQFKFEPPLAPATDIFFMDKIVPSLKKMLGKSVEISLFTPPIFRQGSTTFQPYRLLANWNTLLIHRIVRMPMDTQARSVALYSLQKEGIMTDCQLQTSSGTVIPLHKVILASASETLKTMVVSPNPQMGKNGIIQFKNFNEELHSEPVLTKFVEFLYTNNIVELPSSLTELLDLHDLGTFLDLEGLTHLATVGISEGECVTEETFIHVAGFAHFHNATYLTAFCQLMLQQDRLLFDTIHERLKLQLGDLQRSRQNLPTDDDCERNLTNFHEFCEAYGFVNLNCDTEV